MGGYDVIGKKIEKLMRKRQKVVITDLFSFSFSRGWYPEVIRIAEERILVHLRIRKPKEKKGETSFESSNKTNSLQILTIINKMSMKTLI